MEGALVASVVCVHAGVAQLVERRFCKPRVGGSSPFASSRWELVTSGSKRGFVRGGIDHRPSSTRNRRDLGGVPEWLKGADCKSAGLRPTKVRILPSPPRSLGEAERSTALGVATTDGGNSSAGRASAFQAEGRGFESRFPLQIRGNAPRARASRRRAPAVTVPAHVAQSVEHFLGKEEVTGSNPVMGSRPEDARMIRRLGDRTSLCRRDSMDSTHESEE